MKTGRLRKKVTIQTPTTTVNLAGNTLETWSTLATVWADIEPLSGREAIQARAFNAEATIRARMRYLSTLTTQCRLYYGTRYLEILSIINKDEMGREMELLCTEAV